MKIVSGFFVAVMLLVSQVASAQFYVPNPFPAFSQEMAEGNWACHHDRVELNPMMVFEATNFASEARPISSVEFVFSVPDLGDIVAAINPPLVEINVPSDSVYIKSASAGISVKWIRIDDKTRKADMMMNGVFGVLTQQRVRERIDVQGADSFYVQKVVFDQTPVPFWCKKTYFLYNE